MTLDPKKLLDAGFRDLIPIVPPGAPLAPGSSIKPEARGKVPGKLTSQGWCGNNWPNYQATPELIERWISWGAGYGLKTINFPAGDIDVTDERLAEAIADLMMAVLGWAPTRVGQYPKRLLPYRTDEPFTKLALEFVDPGGRSGRVEFLGKGQQFVIIGVHPATGRPYTLDVPEDQFTPERLTKITADEVRAFLAGPLRDFLIGAGCSAIGGVEGGGRTDGGNGVDRAALKGDIDLVEGAVRAIPNTLDYDRWIAFGHAVRGATQDDPGRGLEIWQEFCSRWQDGDVDPEVAEAKWGGFDPHTLGADYIYTLAHGHGWHADARAEFEALERAPDADGKDDENGPSSTVSGSEDALALWFTARHGADLRYVAKWGRWLRWDGTRWREDDTLAVYDLARAVCREAARRTGTKKLATAATVAAVERLARSDRRHAATVDQWDADPWLISTPTCAVELRGAITVRDNRREDYATRTLTVGYDAEAGCPLWMAFLERVTRRNKPLMAYLARVAGYGLTGCTREHVLFFFYGTGANGKSVFVNTLAGIWGDYAVNAPMETFLATSSDRHPTDLAGLRGARLVTATETQAGRRWDEAKLKALTGGDRISARFMRQDFFTYTPAFKLLVSGNHKPSLRNVDIAIRRRIHLVPFTVTIPEAERDQDLTDKLMKEWPGILAWAVAGCMEWQRTGLAPPEAVTSATEAYFESEDALAAWLEDRCELDPRAVTASAKLFQSWSAWAAAAGEFAGSAKRFGQSLEGHGFKRDRLGNSERAYSGIKLRDLSAGAKAAADGLDSV